MQSNFAFTNTPWFLGVSTGIATGSLKVTSPVAWPSTPSVALNSTNLVSPSSNTNLKLPVAEAPSAPAKTKPGNARHTTNNVRTKAPIMLFILRGLLDFRKVGLVGRGMRTLMHQSQIAPHDNEQKSALSLNAYFYPHFGHTFFNQSSDCGAVRFWCGAGAGRQNTRQSCGRYSRPTQSSVGGGRHPEQ